MRACSISFLVLGGLVTAFVACSLTTSFDGISGGTKPGVDSGSALDTGDASTTAAVPPVRPTGAATAGGGKKVMLGVKHFHYAHSNDALKVPGAWQDWGFDIDHECTGETDGTQAGTCIRAAGITADVVKDGKLCRDNQLGSQIVPQLNTYNSHFENDTNSGLLDGAPTLVFVVDDIGAGDDPYAPGKLYLVGRTKGRKPAWDGTDVRDALTGSLIGGNIDTPIVTFDKAYITGDTWVSGEPSDFQTKVPMGETGELLPLDLHAGVISFKLNDTRTGAVDGTGAIAGAIPAASLEAFLKPFVLTQTIFCPATPQYTTFMERVVTFVDVVITAPNLQDSKKNCDGVSLGLGINLAPVAALGSVVDDPGATTACGGGDAGADGASDAGGDAAGD